MGKKHTGEQQNHRQTDVRLILMSQKHRQKEGRLPLTSRKRKAK